MIYLSLLFNKHVWPHPQMPDHRQDQDSHKKENHKKDEHKTDKHQDPCTKCDSDKGSHNQQKKDDNKGHSSSQGHSHCHDHKKHHHKKKGKDCDKRHKKHRRKKHSKRWLFPVISFAGLFTVSKARRFLAKRKKQQNICPYCSPECSD